jgi:hypothetical protein
MEAMNMKSGMIVAAAGLGALLLGTGVAHAQAVQACATFDAAGKAHINDSLFEGKARTSATGLTEFCMSLVGPGLGVTGPTVFTIHTSPSGVTGSCAGSSPDATQIKVSCEDDFMTKLEGRVK